MSDRGLIHLLGEIRRIRLGFRSELRGEALPLSIAAFAVAVIAFSNTVLIWLLGQPLNLIFAQDFGPLLPLILGLILLVVINQAAHFAARILTNAIGLRFVGRLRNRVLGHLLQVSVPIADRFAKGDLLSRLSHDVDEIQRVLVEYPVYILSHVLTVIFYIGMLLFIDVQLASVALILTPLFFIHQQLFARHKRHAAASFMRRNGALLAFEHTLTSFLKPLTSFGAGLRMREKHRQRFDAAYEAAMKERWIDALFDVTLNGLLYVCVLLVVFVGIGFVSQGELLPGALVSFLIYLGYLSVPVRGLADMPFRAQSGLAATYRIDEVLTQVATIDVAQDAVRLPLTETINIEIRDLCFSYKSDKVLIKDLSICLNPGEKIALVGPSGSGKSTLISLILRLYDPQRGGIYFNGRNIRELELESLRAAISVVWQDALLLPMSIRENLSLANPDVSEKALEQACVDSGAWSFIQEMDEQLDTIIGEGGVMLSGGQAQRLSIARAFIRNAPVLLMDEPTSALDSESEKHVMQSLERLSQGRTTLIIAHRFSTIRAADRVVFLNGDGSVSIGTHEQLMRDHPSYRAIVTWQTNKKE